MGQDHCCGAEKMCSITCCPCGLDLEKVKSMANAPKYICEACGRVANSDENLCKPVAIN